MTVDAKLMTAVLGIKQSIERSSGPGVSVNSHPNPFFLNVNGALDLKAAAEQVIRNIESYEAALRERIEKSIKAAEVEAQKLASGVQTEAEKIAAQVKGLL